MLEVAFQLFEDFGIDFSNPSFDIVHAQCVQALKLLENDSLNLILTDRTGYTVEIKPTYLSKTISLARYGEKGQSEDVTQKKDLGLPVLAS